jgi:GcrA cell cycle regulator
MTATFGVPITPNTVIGKAHRLKIRFDSNSKNNTFAKHGQGRARASRAVPKAPKPITVARKPPSVAEFVPEPVAIPVSRRVSIDELTFNSCRWPLGDPRSSDFAFCGADRADPHNAFNQYCATHAALAFVPTSKKVNLWRVA